MDSAQTLNSFFDVYVPRVEGEIRRIIDSTPFTPTPGAFLTMLHYHLGFANTDGSPAQVYSGKRIRPMLMLLACQAGGGSADQALPAAAAIELLHNFSLIHDDIEDRDEMRRGRPTLWKLWGEAQAINAGDAMFALAHRALEAMVELGLGAGRVVRALLTFDTAAVALTVGQHLDLSFEMRTDVTVAEYMAMIRGKTGALTQAACEIGAILAGAQPGPVAALAEFGAWLGIAFQLQDDILGIWGNPKLTGKQDSDLNHHKKTLPVLYAAEQDPLVRELYFAQRSQHDEDIATLRGLIEACGAREYTEKQARDAYARSLAALDTSGLSGAAATTLRELAHSLLGRAA